MYETSRYMNVISVLGVFSPNMNVSGSMMSAGTEGKLT